MTEYQERLQELKSLLGLTDAKSLARKEELFQWFENNSKGEERQKQLDNFIDEGLDEQRKEIEVLRSEIDSSYKIIPVAI